MFVRDMARVSSVAFRLTMIRLARFPPCTDGTSSSGCEELSCHKGWSSGSGSGWVTSRPAPNICPSCRAMTRSSVLITSPLATLTTIDDFFMRLNCFLLSTPFVCEVNAQFTMTTSACRTCVSRSVNVPTFKCLSCGGMNLSSMGSAFLRSTVTSGVKGAKSDKSDSVIPPAPRMSTFALKRVASLLYSEWF